MIQEDQVFANVSREDKWSQKVNLTKIQLLFQCPYHLDSNRFNQTNLSAQNSHALVQETLFCLNTQRLVCPICQLHGEIGSFNDGQSHKDDNVIAASQVVLRCLQSIEQLHERIAFFVDNLVKQNCVTREIIEKIDPLEMAAGQGQSSTSQTLLPAMSIKGDGLNSGMSNKMTQVEIRKIKNGDRADLVAYGPKSSIDQFQKMYQELTKQMAEESDDDSDECSEIEGEDSRSSSSSEHGIIFHRRTAPQPPTVKSSAAQNLKQHQLHDNNSGVIPPAQILIDASALLNTKNRRKQKQTQKTFEYKQANQMQHKNHSKEIHDMGGLKMKPLEADATANLQDIIGGAKTIESLNPNFHQQEKVSNSCDSNKGQHGASAGKPHSLSFDSINNQSDEVATNIKGAGAGQQKESVNDRYTRLMELLKNEPQAITHLQAILRLEKKIDGARDAIYKILDKKVTHQQKSQHFATLSQLFPEESPESQILKVSLTTLTLSRLLSLLDSLSQLIQSRFHFDFMRLQDLCQIFRQQLERQIFRAFHQNISERLNADRDYRMTDAEQRIFLQNQQVNLDFTVKDAAGDEEQTKDVEDSAVTDAKDEHGNSSQNKQIEQIYSQHQRNHDPYNYSEKTSSDSSDDYYDQVDGRHVPLDSSDNDTFGSSESSEESMKSMMSGSDDVEAAVMFEASKGKSITHAPSKNIQTLNQKTRSRQIAKNKWRKQIRHRRQTQKNQQRKQDFSACQTTESQTIMISNEQTSLIDQIINEHEIEKQKGRLTAQQIESQSKLIDHLKGISEVINSQTRKSLNTSTSVSVNSAKTGNQKAAGVKKSALSSKPLADKGSVAKMPLVNNTDEFFLDDLLIEEQYRINDLQQREALRAEIQIYLFQGQKDFTNDQISHAIQVIVEIDRKHQEIIIDNFEKIEDVLEECQSLMAMTDIEDLAKLDLKDFKEEDQQQAQADKSGSTKQQKMQQQALPLKKSADAKNIIEELKAKIIEQQRSQKDMYQEKFTAFKSIDKYEKSSGQMNKILEDYMRSSVDLITPHEDIRQKQEQLASIQSLYCKVSQLHQKIMDSVTQTEKYDIYNLQQSKSKKKQKSASRLQKRKEQMRLTASSNKVQVTSGDVFTTEELYYYDEEEEFEGDDYEYDEMLKDFQESQQVAKSQHELNKKAKKDFKNRKNSQDQQDTELFTGSVESNLAEDNEAPAVGSTSKKNKNRKKRAKKIVKDQDLQLLTEYALSIKYSSDPQICDINRNRKNNKEIFSRPKLYCAKQLLNQNKNIIVSIGPVSQNNKDSCHYPVIYDQSLLESTMSQPTNGNKQVNKQGQQSSNQGQTVNLLKTVKYTLNNWDIPYFDQNHAVYSILEIDNFVITGHAHGYISMWESLSCGKRVINQYLPCIDRSGKDWNEALGQINLQAGQYDITGIMQVNKTVASSLIIVCCQSGELMILKINGRNRTIDLIHLVNVQQQQTTATTQCQGKDQNSQQKQRGGKVQNTAQNQPKRSSLYGLAKLGDGRFVLMSSKGFTIWQVQGLQQPNSQSKLSVAQKNVLQSQIKLQQQSKISFIQDEAISQVIETQSNIVVCSTMSCNYYMVNLKNGQIEAKIQGKGKYAVDLVRAPIFQKLNIQMDSKDQEGATFSQSQMSQVATQSQQKFCGIESNCIVIIDFEKQEIQQLRSFQKTEFKSPWYCATFYLKDRPDLLVVGEELSGQTRCFHIQNHYVDTSCEKLSTVSTSQTERYETDAHAIFGSKDQSVKTGQTTKTNNNVMF